jgi:thiol-disulfide isomerase/thioredoxin
MSAPARRCAPLLLLVGAAVLGCNPPPMKSAATDAATGSVPSASPPPSAPTSGGRVELLEASTDTDALSLIRTKRLEARAAGRVLVVYVGATWCDPCKKFKAEVQSGRLDARLARVTLLAFDADRDAARLGAAGYSYKFVPFVALPAADGSPADSQQATGKGGEAWRELLGKLETWQL